MDKETIHVRHELTDDDRIRIGSLLADKSQEIADLEEEKKSVVANFTDRIKAARIIATKCTQSLRQNWEMRPTEVKLKPDYSTGEMILIARSTGEEVGRRELTMEERQLRIDHFEDYDE